MGKPRRATKPAASSLQNHPSFGRMTMTGQSSPGVLVLSVTREPVYVAGSARKFLAELSDFRLTSWADHDALPLAVHAVCDELEHSARRDWDKREVHHLAHTEQRSLLLRGYGVADGRSGRFLILLSTEPVSTPKGPAPEYRFTERQRTILDGLVQGQTNKQIAASMTLSVHTVKEYVRQLMMKLETTTRTGIVARMAGLAHPSKRDRSSPVRPLSAQSIEVA